MPEKCECYVPDFPDRCDIQQDSSAAGNPIEDFSGTAFKSGVPCKVIDTGGDETFRGRQKEAHIVAVVEMNYFSGVLPTMRLEIVGGIHTGRVLNIDNVHVIRKQGRPPMLNIYAKEKVAV